MARVIWFYNIGPLQPVNYSIAPSCVFQSVNIYFFYFVVFNLLSTLHRSKFKTGEGTFATFDFGRHVDVL